MPLGPNPDPSVILHESQLVSLPQAPAMKLPKYSLRKGGVQGKYTMGISMEEHHDIEICRYGCIILLAELCHPKSVIESIFDSNVGLSSATLDILSCIVTSTGIAAKPVFFIQDSNWACLKKSS